MYRLVARGFAHPIHLEAGLGAPIIKREVVIDRSLLKNQKWMWLLGLAVVAGLWIQLLVSFLHEPRVIDDAYMFYRYGLNMKHGYGISWNPGGPPTFGETSLLWGLLVYPLTCLQGSPTVKLGVLSWVFSGIAIVATAWAAIQNGREQSIWELAKRVVVIGIPLLLTSIFRFNAGTGMETMAAVALVALYCGSALRWNEARASIWPSAIIGILLYLTRPEAAVVVVLLPSFLVLTNPASKRWNSLGRLLGLFVLCLAIFSLFEKLYFSTPVPLSFYLKGFHLYEGYRRRWHPFTSFAEFASSAWVFLFAIIALSRREHRPILIAFGISLAVVCGYLLTILQIMGDLSRYYIPYFPLIVIPAAIMVFSQSPSEAKQIAGQAYARFALAAGAVGCVVALALAPGFRSRLLPRLDAVFERNVVAYDAVRDVTDSSTPLPTVPRPVELRLFGDDLSRPLPPGAKVATTEVGYIGAAAPQVDVIDMAGLNDTQIATHGFTPEEFLARRPDLIWLPHTDYTYQRGILLTDRSLFRDYVVFAGMGSGLAVRRDGPYRAQIEREWDKLWKQLYPGYRMRDYEVRAATWSRAKHAVPITQVNG